jgi:hypothetical protein
MLERTKVVGGQHNAILEFNTENTGPGDDGLLGVLDTRGKGVLWEIGWALVDGVGAIQIYSIVSLNGSSIGFPAMPLRNLQGGPNLSESGP